MIQFFTLIKYAKEVAVTFNICLKIQMLFKSYENTGTHIAP